MPTSLKIVFFGSGPVAAASLHGLCEAGFDIEAVVTKPAKHKRDIVPVADYALSHNMSIHYVSAKAELDELFAKTRLKSQVGVVVDFGIIISQEVIDHFAMGIVNSHFSLLPQWRGADPITFSVLSGQKETGVSLMVINNKLDEGRLIAQEKIAVSPDETAHTLTNKLVELSNHMLKKYLPLYVTNDIKLYNQTSENITYSRKLTKDDGVINTQKPADQIEREIRAYQGWPKSTITLFGHRIIVKRARVARDKADGALIVGCGDGTFLEVTEVIAPSGRLMSGADFMRGYNK